MNLRERNYPANYWLQLHQGSRERSPSPPRKKHRALRRHRVRTCLSPLSPHIQLFVYTGAIDKRKGEIRSSKFPLSPAQFSMMKILGASRKYEQVPLLEQSFDLEYQFRHKGYARGVKHIQFRLQAHKPVIVGKDSILFLRIRYHQKAPVIVE